MKILALGAGLLFVCAAVPIKPAWANTAPLHISTQTQVSEEGKVHVFLTLENRSDRTLHHVHPMIHFHHTMAMLTHLRKLDPGQSITMKNSDHPPVRSVGRYPLIAMVHYRNQPSDKTSQSLIHTDSFYYREQVESQVAGKIESVEESGETRLKILLTNQSPALKNVRLMLLMPPGLVADTFKGMVGFTLRGGEQKLFEVPVERTPESHEVNYPVHLMIEYAEMLKHYTGEVRGELRFGPIWNAAFLGPHLLVLSLMSLALYLAYRKWGVKFRFRG